MALTPVALAEGMALADQLFGPAPGQPARQMNYRNIPTAVFTHPPIGMVGLTEEQARAAGRPIRVYRSDFRPLRHTLSGSGERALVKLIVDDASDRVIGLHMAGPDAPEITKNSETRIGIINLNRCSRYKLDLKNGVGLSLDRKSVV